METTHRPASFETALVNSNLPVSREMQEWASKCPDKNMLSSILARSMFLASKQECHMCRESFERSELRFDRSYWNSGELICRDCWTSYDCGTAYDPDYKAPPWPETLVLSDQTPKLKGRICLKSDGSEVGRVSQYVPSIHFGHVTLYEYGDDCAEFGSLDPNHVVVDLVPMTEEEDGEDALHSYIAHLKDQFETAWRMLGCDSMAPLDSKAQNL